MHKKINTRRALLTSVVSMLLCITMLIGSTFAWFTDNATTNVNTIQAGTLDIGLYSDEDCTNTLEGESLSFIKADGAPKDEEVLFEPGAKYALTPVYLKNQGNLHVKYKIQITGINGNSKLAEVLDVYVENQNLGTLMDLVVKGNTVGTERYIAPKDVHSFGTIELHMQESAGNEYQGLSISGIAITVVATQHTVEYDSYENTYDAGAEYAQVVESQDALKDAIANAPADKPLNVTLPSGDYTLPDVSGKDLVVSGNKDTVVDMEKNIPSTGTNATFEGVTVKFDNDGYEGLQHSEKVVYKDCTIIGTQFLYSDAEFINCTFEMANEETEYSVWTYGAKNVTFTNCTFNTNGKAVLVYIESEIHANITLNSCTFNSTGKFTDKAAVEVGSSPYSDNTTYNIYINNCTANGFVANKSTSNLWGNKNDMDKNHLNVVIDGVDVY